MSPQLRVFIELLLRWTDRDKLDADFERFCIWHDSAYKGTEYLLKTDIEKFGFYKTVHRYRYARIDLERKKRKYE